MLRCVTTNKKVWRLLVEKVDIQYLLKNGIESFIVTVKNNKIIFTAKEQEHLFISLFAHGKYNLIIDLLVKFDFINNKDVALEIFGSLSCFLQIFSNEEQDKFLFDLIEVLITKNLLNTKEVMSILIKYDKYKHALELLTRRCANIKDTDMKDFLLVILDKRGWPCDKDFESFNNELLTIFFANSSLWDLTFTQLQQITIMLPENKLVQEKFPMVLQTKLNELENRAGLWGRIYKEYIPFEGKQVNGIAAYLQFSQIASFFERPGTHISSGTHLCGPTAIINILSVRAPETLFELYMSLIKRAPEYKGVRLVYSEYDAKLSINHRLTRAIKRGLNKYVGYTSKASASSYRYYTEAYQGITGSGDIVRVLDKLGALNIEDDIKIDILSGYAIPSSLLSLLRLGYSDKRAGNNISSDTYLKSLSKDWNILLFRDPENLVLSHYVIGKVEMTEDNKVKLCCHETAGLGIKSDIRYALGTYDKKDFLMHFKGAVKVQGFGSNPQTSQHLAHIRH